MTVHGVMIIDGKEHKIEASSIKFELEYASPTAQAARGPEIPMGMQVSETISISGGTLTTSSTVRSADGKTTTTTTTTTTGNSTTTTNTTTTK